MIGESLEHAMAFRRWKSIIFWAGALAGWDGPCREKKRCRSDPKWQQGSNLLLLNWLFYSHFVRDFIFGGVWQLVRFGMVWKQMAFFRSLARSVASKTSPWQLKEKMRAVFVGLKKIYQNGNPMESWTYYSYLSWMWYVYHLWKRVRWSWSENPRLHPVDSNGHVPHSCKKR